MNKNALELYDNNISCVFDGINSFNGHKCINNILYGFYKIGTKHLYSKNDPIDLNALPLNLTEIDKFCFINNQRIYDYTTSKNLKFIGNNAFTNSSIKKLKITNKLEFVGIAAFAYCENLEEIYLEGDCVSILDNAFAYCPNLKSVTIKGYADIEPNAFLGCFNLKNVHIDDCSMRTFKDLLVPSNVIRTFNLDSKIYKMCKRNNLITDENKNIFLNTDE